MSFYLIGPVSAWHRWIINNQMQYSWEGFLDAMQMRLGISVFYDSKTILKDVRQTSTVVDYKAQFSNSLTKW